MPLTASDMQYFIDPIATPYENTTKVFVQQVRHERNHVLNGKIINVKGVGEVVDQRMWYSTESGYYVYGHAVGHASVPRYSNVVARVGDLFVHGELMATHRKSPGKRNLMNVRLSNGKRVPGSCALPVTDWIQAAGWAYECMPTDGDNDDVIMAKLELAKQYYTTRFAKLEVMRQGLSRGWTADLKALQDTGVMFKGTYGARVTGTALLAIMPDDLTLSEGQKGLLEGMKNSPVATHTDRHSVYVGVPVAFYAPLEAPTLEQAQSPSTDTISAHLRNKPGLQHALMGTSQTTPVLTGTWG